MRFAASDIRDGIEWNLTFDAVCFCEAEQFCVDHGFELMGRLVSTHDSKRDLISEAIIEAEDAVKQ